MNPLVNSGPVLTLTFALAIIGYIGLTASVIDGFRRGKVSFWLWRPAGLIIVTHVIMVWAFRYQWEFGHSVRNGYFGFILFHTALLIILMSMLMSSTRARFPLLAAYLIVTAGALGASFRYEIVAMYRIQVILGAATGCGYLAWHWIQSQNRKN